MSLTALTSTGSCDALNTGASCRVIRGVSPILLDDGAKHVEDIGYPVIAAVLDDLDHLQQYTSTLLHSARMIRPIGETLIVLTPPTVEPAAGSATVKIAVAAGFTSFFVTGLLFYGVWRGRDAPRVAHYQAKRRKYFESLEQNTPSGWMTTETMRQTVTWSVSDLTSDSQSIKSSMKMDRIDEEAPFEDGVLDESLEESELEVSDDTVEDLEAHPFATHWPEEEKVEEMDVEEPVRWEGPSGWTPEKVRSIEVYDITPSSAVEGDQFLNETTDSSICLFEDDVFATPMQQEELPELSAPDDLPCDDDTEVPSNEADLTTWLAATLLHLARSQTQRRIKLQ